MKITNSQPSGTPKRNTDSAGGVVIGGGPGTGGEVPVDNGDGTATWAPITADIVTYDPTASGLSATDVQAAIDEVVATGGGGGSPNLDGGVANSTYGGIAALDAGGA